MATANNKPHSKIVGGASYDGENDKHPVAFNHCRGVRRIFERGVMFGQYIDECHPHIRNMV